VASIYLKRVVEYLLSRDRPLRASRIAFSRFLLEMNPKKGPWAGNHRVFGTVASLPSIFLFGVFSVPCDVRAARSVRPPLRVRPKPPVFFCCYCPLARSLSSRFPLFFFCRTFQTALQVVPLLFSFRARTSRNVDFFFFRPRQGPPPSADPMFFESGPTFG